jgi:hypothetical protein
MADMDIDRQLQDLYEQAPEDGMTPNAVRAIAPALKLVAGQLKHPEYYILQTLDQRWVMATLNQPKQPDAVKNVVYAFAALKDAIASPASKDPQVIALPMPVTHILFQMVAMTSVNSIIFFEVAGNLSKGSEVTRDSIQQLLQTHLQQLQSAPPSDIA